MTRVGVLLSGRGSNFLALHAAMARGAGIDKIPAHYFTVTGCEIP